MSEFGRNLKILRIKSGLTQAKMADELMVSRPAIGAYEEGRAEPKYDRLIIIAQYFNTTIDQLLTEKF